VTSDVTAYCTMFWSYQELMLFSRVPHVYGSMFCVFTPASDGNELNGFTPFNTG